MAGSRKKPSKPAKKSAAKKPSKTSKPASSAKRKQATKRPAAKSTRASRSTKKRAPLRAKRPTPKTKRAKVSRALKPTARIIDPVALALARTIAGVAAEKKALDVTIIDVQARGAQVGYDYVVLASADSDRQLTAIVDAIEDKLRPQGRRPLGVEASAEWVLADFGEVIAHLLTPDRRAVLDLEGQWSDAPRVELGA